MKIIIAASTGWNDKNRIRMFLELLVADRAGDRRGDVEIINGDSIVIDRFIQNEAAQLGMTVKGFPPNWNAGPDAGPVRIGEMLEAEPDFVVAFYESPVPPYIAMLMMMARAADIRVIEIPL